MRDCPCVWRTLTSMPVGRSSSLPLLGDRRLWEAQSARSPDVCSMPAWTQTALAVCRCRWCFPPALHRVSAYSHRTCNLWSFEDRIRRFTASISQTIAYISYRRKSLEICNISNIVQVLGFNWIALVFVEYEIHRIWHHLFA